MFSLNDMNSYPSPGNVPVFEKDGKICCVPQHEMSNHNYLDSYPEINVNGDVFNTSSSKQIDAKRSVIVPVNELVIKRIIRIFFENGFYEALNEARNHEASSSSFIISSIADYTLRALQFVSKVKVMLLPHLKEQGISSIVRYSETRDWIRSYIRCVVWHPNCFKIAVAGSDDVIRIYTDELAVVPVLKCSNQKWITSMAWRPYSAAELAVGCQTGVCLWTMDSNMHITRQVSQSQLLQHRNHCPISSVQWSPDGSLLATASIGDTDILIWNIDKLQNTPLKRVGTTYSLLKWSPDGSYLFSATVGNVFRVWSAERKWLSERWTVAKGFIQSAVWSPCSTYLIFVTSEDSILYRLQFFEEQLFAVNKIPNQAAAIADLSKVTISYKDVGGQPQALAWDPNGHYLAVTFKDSPCIAIFTTHINSHNLSISPSSFLTGINTEFPSYICFQSKNRKNVNSVLTIGWSSGRIQYFPFVKN